MISLDTLKSWSTAALAVAWGLSLFAVGVWQRHDGAVSERLVWQTREAESAHAAADAIQRMQSAARQAEQDHAMEMAALGSSMERRISDANKQREADRAAVSRGTLRLYDRPPGLYAGGCGVSASSAASGERDGRAAGELSREAVGFLLDLVNDADLLAGQLAECQAVIRRDRELGK